MTATYTDYAIVCGLTPDGGWDGAKETDWLHYAIPVKNTEVWEFQFQCCHLSGAPNANVIPAFVAYDNKGHYQATYSAPLPVLVDSTSWQKVSFPYQFAGDLYVFPAIWWHATAVLTARYVIAVQMAKQSGQGASLTVIQPDIFLTLGATGKTLGSDKAIIGPRS